MLNESYLIFEKSYSLNVIIAKVCPKKNVLIIDLSIITIDSWYLKGGKKIQDFEKYG